MIELLKIKDIRYRFFYYTIWGLAIYYFTNALLLSPLYSHYALNDDKFFIIQHHQDFFYHTPNGLGSNYYNVRMFYQPISALIITPITNLFNNYLYVYRAFEIFIALLAGLFWGKALKHLNIFTSNQQIYAYMILMLFAHVQGGISEIREIPPWALVGISFYFFIKQKYFRAGAFFVLSFLEHGVGVFFASPLFVAYLCFNFKTLWQHYFGKELTLKTKIFRISVDFGSIMLGAILIFIAIVSYYNQKIVSLPEAIDIYSEATYRWGNNNYIGKHNPLTFIKATIQYAFSYIDKIHFLIRECILLFIIIICLLFNRLSHFFKVVLVSLFFVPIYTPVWQNSLYSTYYFFIGYMLIALNTNRVFYLNFPKMNYFVKVNSMLLPIIILISSYFMVSRLDGKYKLSIDIPIIYLKRSIEAQKLWSRYNTNDEVVNLLHSNDKPYLPYKQNTILLGNFTNKNVMSEHWKDNIKENNTIYYWISPNFSLNDLKENARKSGIKILSLELVEYGNGKYYKVYKLETDIY